MPKLLKNYFLVMTSMTTLILASNSIDTLLDDFSNKNALSQNTIDKNKGHLMLYTREKLERMHAETLKDVLKTIPILQYNENRYGVTDPLSPGGISPFSSNLIRIYIDNVEVTQGWMGSGLIQYGNINIDFADHIEIYAIPPSFDISAESAYMTIFIYSKIPERDKGINLSLVQGSRGSNTQVFSYLNKKDTTSYMLNVSRTDQKRKKVDNETNRPLSRDFKRTQVFSYIKNENHAFNFQLIENKSDTLAGLSIDATPLQSEMKNMSIHMDYVMHFSEYWTAKFAYDYLDSDLRQEDDLSLLIAGGAFDKSLNIKTKNTTYSTDITYKNIIGKHHLTFGVKGRVKTIDSLYIKNLGFAPLDFDTESIMTVFIQDQYELSQDELFTLGLKYSKVSRNKIYEDDDLYQMRMGYLYNGDTWSYKAYIFTNMFTIDPFSRYFLSNPYASVDPQVSFGFTQELAYHDKHQDIRLLTMLIEEKNNLINAHKINDTSSFISVINYDYMLDTKNDISMQFSHAYYKDIEDIGDVNGFTAYLMLSHLYDSFSIYNGFVWNYNTYIDKKFIDWTSAISWDICEDLTLTLKGNNLLNKARRYQIFRLNPRNGLPLSPLTATSFDQEVSIELEYTF